MSCGYGIIGIMRMLFILLLVIRLGARALFERGEMVGTRSGGLRTLGNWGMGSLLVGGTVSHS